MSMLFGRYRMRSCTLCKWEKQRSHEHAVPQVSDEISYPPQVGKREDGMSTAGTGGDHIHPVSRRRRQRKYAALQIVDEITHWV